MTRRDYVKLAAALALVPRRFASVANSAGEAQAAKLAYRECVLNIADVLQADNPRFQRDRFLEAAGIQLQRTAAAA